MPATPLERIGPEPPAVTSQQLDLVKRTIANGATPAELQLFLYDCQRQGVHPLDRQLHFTKRGGKYTPITSIDLMRTRAADTNEYGGSDDAEFTVDDDGTLIAATVTVWRLVQGHRCAFTATARFAEYVPPPGQDQMWRKMPRTMIAKCAEALALRKGFPRQLAGLYAAEELEQAGVIEHAPMPPAPAPATEPPPPAIPKPPDDGALRIARLTPTTGKGRMVGVVVFSSGEEIGVYDPKVWTYAATLAEGGEPVAFETAISKAGNRYLTAIKAAGSEKAQASMLTEDDIPFSGSGA